MVDQTTESDSLIPCFGRIGRGGPEDIDVTDQRDDDLFVVMDMGRMRSLTLSEHGVVAIQRDQVWCCPQVNTVAQVAPGSQLQWKGQRLCPLHGPIP
jgi:hypothetical protein